ncbi:hypothetical protein RQP46_003006 [Phenoliferia psychrophenolica]
MGNTASTPASRSGSARPSQPNSPVVRQSPIIPDGESARHKVTRRKKSIELSDVDTSLSFTSSPGVAAIRAAHRRKHSDRMADISGEDDLMEPGEGTLRGAMQGRAEHVVYGPRRPNVPLPLASSVGSSTAAVTEEGGGAKPTTIALPNPSTFVSAPIPDPDDTIHPGFTASPRLTADVLLSSDQMPVIVSPIAEDLPSDSPFRTSTTGAGSIRIPTSIAPQTPSSLSHAAAAILSSSSVHSPAYPPPMSHSSAAKTDLLPPHTSPPYPPSHAPLDTVVAPVVPTQALPLSPDAIPSGTGVIGQPLHSPIVTPGHSPKRVASPTVLLPPNLFNAPVAAIPIPLLSVPSATIAASLMAAAVDVGAGPEGVPTLIKWKDEDGQGVDANGNVIGPKEVFVTGTFARGWKMKIELRRTDTGDFSALISLPPGPHRLKFIVDKEWKASKHLQLATDADGNLINYLHVNGAATKTVVNWSSGPTAAGTTTQSQWLMPDDDDQILPPQESTDDADWTQEIPPELVEWGEWEAAREAALDAEPPGIPPPPPKSSNVPPPTLPAQLEKGPLNHAAYVTQGSGDDNSILPKPDHSVINHLAASPIKGGFLSVGVTTRYKRKFVTIVYYKSLAS